MQIIVNNLLTTYYKQGGGPVVLFLHGWGDSSQTFRSLIKLLDSNYTCLSLDLPGFGASQLPPADWSVADYAEFVADFIKKIAVSPDAMVGHSNGGTIAMFGVAQQLLPADKLVLLASAGIRNEDSFKKSVYKAVAKVGKVITKPLPAAIQQKFRRKLYASAGSDILVTPDLEGTFKRVVSQDVLHEAAKISIPTLLLYAQDDHATPVRYGEALHAVIQDSKLKVLPSGGHFIHQSKAGEVTELIQDFLK